MTLVDLKHSGVDPSNEDLQSLAGKINALGVQIKDNRLIAHCIEDMIKAIRVVEDFIACRIKEIMTKEIVNAR